MPFLLLAGMEAKARVNPCPVRTYHVELQGGDYGWAGAGIPFSRKEELTIIEASVRWLEKRVMKENGL